MTEFARYVHLVAAYLPKPGTRPKAKQYTLAEKRAYVKEWKRSGMPAITFAQSAGLNRGTFSHWTRGERMGKGR